MNGTMMKAVWNRVLVVGACQLPCQPFLYQLREGWLANRARSSHISFQLKAFQAVRGRRPPKLPFSPVSTF